MARAVNVSIVTLLGLILNVSGVDGDAALLLLGSLIDGVISLELGLALQGQPLGDGSGQGRLAVVDVTDGADVNMGLGSFKFLLRHLKILLSISNPLFKNEIISTVYFTASRRENQSLFP